MQADSAFFCVSRSQFVDSAYNLMNPLIIAGSTMKFMRRLKYDVLTLIRTNIIVPTFDTKVTEYLCSGWVFFLQTNFDFLTSHF